MGATLMFRANLVEHASRLLSHLIADQAFSLLLTANPSSCKLTAVTLPAFIFGGVIATLYGTAFHLIRGGGLGQLFIYILLSWIGFWAGQFIAEQLNWSFLNLGPLHLGIATISSLILMIIGYWVLIGKKPKDS